MVVLHIEHPITDFEVWTASFDRFAERRQAAGVQLERVCRPVDDARYVVVDLDFPTVEQAESFLRFLTEVVWAVPANSPALAGQASGRVLRVERSLRTADRTS